MTQAVVAFHASATPTADVVGDVVCGVDPVDPSSTVSTEKMAHILKSSCPSKEHHDQLLAMLQTIDERLSAAGVEYWVTGGTLLGAMRHKGIIPHDDDIDIEIRASDMSRAVDALGSIGRSYRGGGIWPAGEVEMGRFFFWGVGVHFTCSVDVFWRGDELEELAEFPSREELFPLQRVPFNNITVLAPRHAAPVLARCYGESWNDEAVIWSHSAKGRQLLRVPLHVYSSAASEAGYVAPEAASNAALSLARVGLESKGELRELLAESLGWASPYMTEFAGQHEEDPVALEMLGLTSRKLPFPEPLCSSPETWAEKLRSRTGLFVYLIASTTAVDTGEGAKEETSVVGAKASYMLQVVGTEDEVSAVDDVLAEFVANVGSIR
eukprot:TRINITY_DN26481_c0_g1_i1.p1 TRINITY_DN26481_c0_g1~~TRINITY_DN26481_c0_g1_i1.p1  ORF type:complete len:381 (-),score=60.71 TRINITY_DN26481_c0_g1_i1:2-1144(-)